MSKGVIAGYIRVSTQEQKLHGISIDSQEAALRQYAKDNDYDIKIYSDAGISAHITYKRRPALLRMVRDCKLGLIQLICVTKLDRFFRSVNDYYRVFDQIGTPWRAIWEDYETETAAGQFKVNIMLAVAQAESDRAGERIRAIWDYKRSCGLYIGRLPVGYMRDPETRKIIKTDQAPAIDLIIDTYKRTLSMRACHDEALAAGYGDFSKYIIKNILTSDIYCGIAEQEEFEAYIQPQDVKLIHEAISRHKREHTTHGNVFLFSGLVKCPRCGATMLAVNHYSKRKNGKNDVYTSYRCSRSYQYKCKSSIYSENVIERLALERLDALALELPSNLRVIAKADKDNAKKETALKSRLKRLSDLFEMGDISKDDYIKRRDELKLELVRLEAASNTARPLPVLPDKWRDIYESLNQEHKHIFWQKIIKDMVPSVDRPRTLEVNFL